MSVSASVLLAALLGILVGLLAGDPLPGITFGLGLLIGGIASILVVPALRAAPAGLKGAAIDDAASGWAEFHRELARARRFDGQFAIVCFSRGESPDPEELVSLRNEIAASSRRIDRLWIDGGHILLLLPETTQAAADAVLARIRALAPAALSIEPGVARFPEHGITSGALIAAVFGSGQEDVPTPIGAARPDFRPQSAPDALVAETVVAGPSDDMATQSG